MTANVPLSDLGRLKEILAGHRVQLRPLAARRPRPAQP